MITYLLESSLSLLVTFGLYKIWLENKPIHQFKRVYLLVSLLFSAIVPLISVEFWSITLPLADVQPVEFVERGLVTTLRQTMILSKPDEVAPAYWLWLYGVITATMLTRFGWNVYRLIQWAVTSPNQPFRGARLVQLNANGLPYTFLHFLFVSESAYHRGTVEDELFTHELAHIQQRHSLDVLLIELLICVGWFNPLLG